MKVSLIIKLLVAAALSACTSISERNLYDSNLQKLEVGVSTKAKVNKVAGYPLFSETYTKEDVLAKLEGLVGTPIPENAIGDGNHTLWIFPTYFKKDDVPANYDTYLLFDEQGILQLVRTN